MEIELKLNEKEVDLLQRYSVGKTKHTDKRKLQDILDRVSRATRSKYPIVYKYNSKSPVVNLIKEYVSNKFGYDVTTYNDKLVNGNRSIKIAHSMTYEEAESLYYELNGLVDILEYSIVTNSYWYRDGKKFLRIVVKS